VLENRQIKRVQSLECLVLWLFTSDKISLLRFDRTLPDLEFFWGGLYE